MALTQGNWSVSKVNQFTVYTCTVTATTAENDAYTKPVTLDTTRKFTIVVNSTAQSLDATTLPVDLWMGFDTVGLTGDGGTVKWTSDNGYQIQGAVIADVQSAVGVYSFDPKNTAASAPGPYLVINLDGGSTLNAATCTFVIVQEGV